jgi:hypothetical protein
MDLREGKQQENGENCVNVDEPEGKRLAGGWRRRRRCNIAGSKIQSFIYTESQTLFLQHGL